MQLVPWYFRDVIVGYEDDSASDSTDESSEEEGEEEEEEEEQGGDGEKPPTQDDVDRINKALRAERKLRRDAEKQLKQAQKAKDDDVSTQELEQLRQREAASTQKSEKLAARLLTQAIEGSIVKAATKLNFRDVDDAVTLVSREDIDWEQDEDDPSEVDVDEASVTDAVKALAKKRPYLLATESPGGEASGGQFGGASNRGDGLTDETLRDIYPALRRGGSVSGTRPRGE
jgi:hypothetical protein